MRNELLDRSSTAELDDNLIDYVQRESKQECLQRYERPFYDAERGEGANGWYNLLTKIPALLNNEQFAVFRAVHQWRDNVARQEDESLYTIMPKNVMFSISKEMPLDMPSLLSHAQLSSSVRSHATELLESIKEAKARGVNGPDMKDFLKSHPAKKRNFIKNNNQINHQTMGNLEIASFPRPSLYGQEDASFRTNVSKFWGCTVEYESSKQTGDRSSKNRNFEIRLAIPLPQLTAEVMLDGLNDKPDSDKSDANRPGGAEHQYVRDRKPAEKNIFVIRELGGPRKRKAAELEGNDAARSPIPLNQKEDDVGDLNAVNTDEVAKEKAQLKAAGKAQKKLKKERERQEAEQCNGRGGGVSNGEAEEPIDYANAPSVLYAKHDKFDKAGSQNSFDPYVKSMDAPKGMRKLQKEISGRSHTFKS